MEVLIYCLTYASAVAAKSISILLIYSAAVLRIVIILMGFKSKVPCSGTWKERRHFKLWQYYEVQHFCKRKNVISALVKRGLSWLRCGRFSFNLVDVLWELRFWTLELSPLVLIMSYFTARQWNFAQPSTPEWENYNFIFDKYSLWYRFITFRN